MIGVGIEDVALVSSKCSQAVSFAWLEHTKRVDSTVASDATHSQLRALVGNPRKNPISLKARLWTFDDLEDLLCEWSTLSTFAAFDKARRDQECFTTTNLRVGKPWQRGVRERLGAVPRTTAHRQRGDQDLRVVEGRGSAQTRPRTWSCLATSPREVAGVAGNGENKGASFRSSAQGTLPRMRHDEGSCRRFEETSGFADLRASGETAKVCSTNPTLVTLRPWQQRIQEKSVKRVERFTVSSSHRVTCGTTLLPVPGRCVLHCLLASYFWDQPLDTAYFEGAPSARLSGRNAILALGASALGAPECADMTHTSGSHPRWSLA